LAQLFTKVTNGQTPHDDISRAYASHRAAKTRMVGLPDGEKKFEDMCNRLGTIPACDRQTDGQTDTLPRHSPRYKLHTHRAVKMKSCIGQTAASKTLSVHPMHRYSPVGAIVNISRVSLNLKHPDVRLFTFSYFSA